MEEERERVRINRIIRCSRVYNFFLLHKLDYYLCFHFFQFRITHVSDTSCNIDTLWEKCKKKTKEGYAVCFLRLSRKRRLESIRMEKNLSVIWSELLNELQGRRMRGKTSLCVQRNVKKYDRVERCDYSNAAYYSW